MRARRLQKWSVGERVGEGRWGGRRHLCSLGGRGGGLPELQCVYIALLHELEVVVVQDGGQQRG